MKICLECEGITDTNQSACPSCDAPLTDTAAVHFPLRRGEADAGHPMLGTVIDGKYLVQGVLGKGGMGTVFRAIHQVSLIPVALKILNPRFSARREYREYFLAEAQKAGRVTHEHVGRILDVGEAEDGTVYIAMEEVNGLTLHECIHGGQPLAPALVVEILEQVCEGLSAAHHAGLVHRDLSPRNVMVIVRQGRPFVKILDFGIAKGLPLGGADVGGEAVHAPAGFASPPYSAPEHLEGHDVDGRADLYSLGAIAYEALTRRLPVRGSTPQERADATLAGELLPLPVVPGCPSRLTRLVQGLLSREPRARPASVDVVLRALAAIRQPKARLVRDIAMIVCVLAISVVVMAYTRSVEPVLAKQVGDLEIAQTAEGLQGVQHCRSVDLGRLRFEFEGFAAGELDVLVTRVATNETLFDVPLGAVEVDGGLELDAKRSQAYAEVVARLAEVSRDGPVQLTFKLREGATLGAARVRVDDDPPELRIERVGDATRALNAADRLMLHCEDEGGVRRVQLEVRGDGAGFDPFTTYYEFDELRTPIVVGELFGQKQARSGAMGRVQLRLKAHDQAGNGADEAVWFDVDVVAPKIVTTEPFTATLLGTQSAQLVFRLEEAEPGLRLFLRRSSETWREVEAARFVDTVVHVPLPWQAHDTATEFQFQVRDAAGNSTETTRMVRFLAKDAKFQVVTTPAQRESLRPFDGGLVWTGVALGQLRVECNPLYRPVGVSVERLSVGARLVRAEKGAGILALDAAAADGVGALVVTLEDTANGSARVPERVRLRVQSSPLQLRLPDATAARFEHEVAKELFVATGDVYRQSARWALKPLDYRLLGGSILWMREGDEPVRADLADRQYAVDPFFAGQAAVVGTNVIHLDLLDPFGRPVEVFLGARSTPEPRTRLGVRIARFEAYTPLARRQPDPIRLEHRQPPVVTLTSDYTFTTDDRQRLRLVVRGQPTKCSRIERIGAETRLTFVLDYARVVAAADLKLDDPRLREEGKRFTFNFQLQTPAGVLDFRDVPLSTRRSSLMRQRLGDRFSGLAKELGALEFVPVLRPLGPYADRAPADLRRQGAFLRRQAIAVKGLQDVFVQSRELSFAEYRAIVTAFLALSVQQRPAADAIVFPGDPAGAQRLSAKGMIPVLDGGDVAAFDARAAKEGGAPVTGLSFYQAYAIARMAGCVVGGDPELFRLPFGVEMELAATGDRPAGTLNGVAGQRVAALQAADDVTGPRGAIRGLDFGVREWVLDLPWPVSDETQQGLVEGWMTDHAQHRRYATGFEKLVTLPALRDWLRRAGVVRGVALDTTTELLDLKTGVRADHTGTLTAGVPGVTRESFVWRSGEGLGGPDRQLRHIGMRLVGSAAFVARMRAK